MKRRLTKYAKDKDRRTCTFCLAPISVNRPVFLVGTPSGRIVGPYHAGCAERVALMASRKVEEREPRGEDFGRIIPPAREETLPW